MDGKVAPVALAAVAVDFDKAPDVLAHFAPEVAFDDEVLVDDIADAEEFLIGEFARLGIGADGGLSENLLRAGEPDAIDVG
jgi:hypothetical protein